jgi:hypothetical protein
MGCPRRHIEFDLNQPVLVTLRRQPAHAAETAYLEALREVGHWLGGECARIDDTGLLQVWRGADYGQEAFPLGLGAVLPFVKWGEHSRAIAGQLGLNEDQLREIEF